MKTTSAWMGIAALVAAVSGCDSEVVGGGGGAGGAGSTTGGDGGAAATGTSSGTTGGGASSAESTGTTGPASSSSTGTAGGGGGNSLGECEAESGTSGSSGGGVTECGASYACDGGFAEVSCVDDGTSEVCACSLDGAFIGECNNDPEESGCSFPVGCCYALLGGQAQPNPGPYGACEDAGGSSAQSGGGETACGSTYTCDGGDLWIDCSGVDGQSATCECRDGQGFLLATCEQEAVDCDYASGCCFALVN